MPNQPHSHHAPTQHPAAERTRHERAVLAALGDLLDELAALGPGDARFGRPPSIVVRRPAPERDLTGLGATA
ncbi:hypothetical protein [Kitasatospora sp. DSM 101779]|uniref:hypothetical protein n=1 Tax=Kitasatospora sp. DSM 101779 TaxID=2853165 RepID=UPI0021D85702|nr:hypothetical protein [Kitasatospora sp. DSM 101779]MCU7826813.1 hypothetical protein [Kitasatospora sp. DSM 101779]